MLLFLQNVLNPYMCARRRVDGSSVIFPKSKANYIVTAFCCCFGQWLIIHSLHHYTLTWFNPFFFLFNSGYFTCFPFPALHAPFSPPFFSNNTAEVRALVSNWARTSFHYNQTCVKAHSQHTDNYNERKKQSSKNDRGKSTNFCS